MLIIKNLSTAYGNIKAIDDISFKAETGKITTIIGANGAGKSTFLKTISGQIPSISGEIQIDGMNINGIANDELPKIISFVSPKMTDVDYVICDFVAPLVEMRNNFKADWTIWVDTIKEGRYEDTNKAFVPPEVYDFRVTEQNCEKWAEFIGEHVLADRRRPVFDWQRETVQMLGRWQPWHDGHRALFERLIARTGQVVIQVRDVQGWQGSNPFEVEKVKSFIKRDLDPLYQGQYEIQVVPNIVHIGWGRGVGYTSGEETFDDAVTDISATKIRKELGLK